MDKNLLTLKKELESELKDNILKFWIDEVYDEKRNTFYGKVSNYGDKYPDHPLSAVLVSRIMWTFSSVCRMYPSLLYKKMADEAYRILLESFWDQENGGIYWSVSPGGEAVDKKKQFYAQVFFIYALSEYYLVFKDEKASQMAVSMFMIMERFAFDSEFGGYIEATTSDWKYTDDQYLSPDNKEIKKTMNTHLHILEAYTNLYRIRKEEQVRKKLQHLLQVFLDNIIDFESGHMVLFFSKNWKRMSNIDSYGHDIEASWLLCEAVDLLDDKHLKHKVERVAEKMALATLNKGFAKHGGMYYEKEETHLKEQFDWWPQAESVVGYFNAWQISGNLRFLEQAQQSWEFIKNYLVDTKRGEWFWGVDSELNVLNTAKVSPWKAPYHNGRMCLEIIRRINSLL